MGRSRLTLTQFTHAALPYIAAGVVLVALDQLFKAAAVARLVEGVPVPLRVPLPSIGGAVRLTLTHNRGAAFGMLWEKQGLFVALSVLALVVIVVAFIRSTPWARLYRTALVLAAAGATGNLIDRLRFGYVIDYVDLQFWPVFNLADAILDVGAVLIVWSILRPSPRRTHEDQKQGS